MVNLSNKEKEIKLPLDACFQHIDGIDDKDLMVVQQVKYAGAYGKDITEEVKKVFSCKPNQPNNNCEKYDVSFVCKYPLIMAANSKISIRIKTETMVPITDQVYIHKITKPCKKYVTNFYINNNDYRIDGWGFAFHEREKMDIIRQPHWLNITFNDWILPGDGAIFLLQKKILTNG
jgi:hypothetical protein